MRCTEIRSGKPHPVFWMDGWMVFGAADLRVLMHICVTSGCREAIAFDMSHMSQWETDVGGELLLNRTFHFHIQIYLREITDNLNPTISALKQLMDPPIPTVPHDKNVHVIHVISSETHVCINQVSILVRWGRWRPMTQLLYNSVVAHVKS